MAHPAPDDHDGRLAAAFDGQAALFEQAPVQTDPAALERLVASAAFPPGSLVLDAGCGPGLVSAALLDAGHRIVGIDLSATMIDRARLRCATFGDRARFECRSIAAEVDPVTCDGAISRYVLHHVVEPAAFIRDQLAWLRPGGVLVLCDQITDIAPSQAAAHNAIERLRDSTHTRNLTLSEGVALFEQAGLVDITAVEEAFTLDFDEWFDRGTPAAAKGEVRARLAGLAPGRAIRVEAVAGGRLTIHCRRGIVRGVVPTVV